MWLGEVSFAFYLVHQSALLDVMRGLHAAGSGPAVGGALALFSLALSVLLAGALHRYVEVPLVRRHSRARHGRHAQDRGGVTA